MSKYTIALIMLITIIVTGCNTVAALHEDSVVQEGTNIRYVSFEIEGMPCYFVGVAGYALPEGGVTCDWTQHKGR